MRELLKLAAPIAAAHLAGMALQLVDTVFVGRLGAVAIGGVSVGNAVFATLMILGLGVLLGLDFLISHAFGGRKLEECNRLLVQAAYLATAFSVPCMLVMHLLSGLFPRLGIAAAISEQGGAYLSSVSYSLWPFLLFTVLRQYLQAMGVAAPVLLILLFGNLVNALGNWVFIYGHWGLPAMGVAGSGYSTTVARTVMLVALAAYVLRRDKKLGIGLRGAALGFSRELSASIVRLGLPAGAQTMFEVGVFAASTLLCGRLGAVPLAAHQIVLLIASFTFMVPLGLAAAAAVIVGKNLGAGQPRRAHSMGWRAIAAGAGIMTLSGITLVALSVPLLRLFTLEDPVIAMGGRLLLIAALFQLSDGVQVVSSGVLRGIGNTRAAMLANLAGHWGLGLPVGVALCFAVGWGAQGLWIGLSLGLTAVAVVLVAVWWKESEALLA